MITDIRKINAKALKAKKKSQADREKRDELEKKLKADRKESRRRFLAETVDGVYFEDEIDGIKVINIEQWNKVNQDVKDTERALFNWCQKNKVHYYARNENFDLMEAVAETAKFKRKVLLYKHRG